MNQTVDIDSLLDTNIDELADLPEFGVLPNGVHTVSIDWESKEVNKHPSVELKMKVIETVELANPAEDTPPAPGTEANVLFMLDNEFGQGKLKAILKVLAAATGTSSLKEAMEASKGMQVQVVAKVRQNKDKTQSYTDITKVIV